MAQAQEHRPLNIPQYRRELRQALQQFRSAVEMAAEVLANSLDRANNALMEDPDEPREEKARSYE